MTTVVKKGATSRSYPSKQRKLGPAPFASFEDISPDDTAADSSKVLLDNIQEDSHVTTNATVVDKVPTSILASSSGTKRTKTPPTAMVLNENKDQQQQHHHKTKAKGPALLMTSTTPSSTFASSSSGVQTPSTPRIDISCASSSTPPSDESNSERELFQGGLGFAFHEEGTEDLRSSTEELDLGEDDLQEESSRKKKQQSDDGGRGSTDLTDDFLRRSSHPANIFFGRKTPTSPLFQPDEQGTGRKPSAHSLWNFDGLLSRPSSCRHASFGSADRSRPLSSLSGRRSVSPHKMLLETSFCGNKPIPTASVDIDSPPKGPSSDPQSFLSGGIISSDSSFETHKPTNLTTFTTVQVHHHNQPITTSAPQYDSAAGHQHHQEFQERNERSNKYSPDSDPKSSDHWKPIPSPRPSPRPSTTSSTSATQQQDEPTSTTTIQHKDISSVDKGLSSSPKTPGMSRKMAANISSNGGGDGSRRKPSTNTHHPPPATSPLSSSSPSPTVNKEFQKFSTTSPPPPVNDSNSKQKQQLTPMPPNKKNDNTNNKLKGNNSSTSLSSGGGGASRGNVDCDEITTGPSNTVEDLNVPPESKGLFLQESYEDDGDLPYVPTTLPLEKSVAVPLVPIKDRKGNLVMTTPLQRPRCIRPPNPTSLNDYIAHSSTTTQSKGTSISMKINLPREDSIPTPESAPYTKKKMSTNWIDFAELGLRSPREIRRKMREENGAMDDSGSYQSDSSPEAAVQINGSDDEDVDVDASLLKPTKGPFGFDLDIPSGRSSVISQEEAAAIANSPSVPPPDISQEINSTFNKGN